MSMEYKSLGRTNIKIPPIIFGTSCLGNLYQALPFETKLNILGEIFKNLQGSAVLDSAGKYGAGLALEVIGKGLRQLDIPPDRVIISNKLGWYQTPLVTKEPTFEPGAWVNLKNDAVQKINRDGIFRCWEQGNKLLGEKYSPQIVSVHDPDEYLAKAHTQEERTRLFKDIVDAYATLAELKEQGVTQAIGVGAKDWTVIREISKEIDLDWVMLAISFTIYSHPAELVNFIQELAEKGISVINSAIFHAGFLTGGKYFDYRILNPKNEKDVLYFIWRDKFFSICLKFDVQPADACVQFALSHPGIISVALNTSNPARIRQNIESVSTKIPENFWQAMKDKNLISQNYSYVG